LQGNRLCEGDVPTRTRRSSSRKPPLAIGLLLVLVVGVHVLHERRPTEVHRSWLAVVAAIAALSLAGLVPYVVRERRLDTGMLMVIACGCGFRGDQRRDQDLRRRHQHRPHLGR
jgi:hypothetical protein